MSTYLTAAQEEAASAGGASTVSWTLGSRVLVEDGRDGLANATVAAAAADLVLLVLGTGTQVEMEGTDRDSLTLPGPQQALLYAVSASVPPACTLVVVLVTAGTVEIDAPRADAVLYAPYAGEETGHGER